METFDFSVRENQLCIDLPRLAFAVVSMQLNFSNYVPNSSDSFCLIKIGFITYRQDLATKQFVVFKLFFCRLWA